MNKFQINQNLSYDAYYLYTGISLWQIIIMSILLLQTVSIFKLALENDLVLTKPFYKQKFS